MDKVISEILRTIYHRLIDCYGHQHWWPAQEQFEVMVGAILTQSAAWQNVEKAITRLKKAGAMSPEALRRLDLSEIGKLIHSCGYYNAKALKLKSLACWLGENYSDSLDELFNKDIGLLRQQLLSVHGVGPETADSIILYAAEKPIFVIDAYTRRIISRIGLEPEGNSYAAYQSLFMDSLSPDVGLYNEYHALLVRLGKTLCRTSPLCRQCCLTNICQFSMNS